MSRGQVEVADDQNASRPARATPRDGDRIVRTAYPGQSVVDPISLEWGTADAQKRGPVLVSRASKTITRRNAIGAHGGSYPVYNALTVAAGDLPPNFRPSFENTQPIFDIPPQPARGDKITMVPFGHDIVRQFKKHFAAGIDVRPTIAITKVTMRLVEVSESLKAVWKCTERSWSAPRETCASQKQQLNLFSTCLCGGSYLELITRLDIKVFLPQIGGLITNTFGPPERVANPDVKLALRIHDECNGSDGFQSDICTYPPCLAFGIEEAIKEAQSGGSRTAIYFRKEGRAFGAVVRYLVYNARKCGGDTADKYFTRIENIAGVRDMRFQALMPDILHWLGIRKIDRMLSMSNMKHDAIVE
ncbi:hypothetical protein BBP40_012443 [Aspergillus hancockii]|nr:hypothetical protein BBP40_012443 [Aspergillus hancockii]